MLCVVRTSEKCWNIHQVFKHIFLMEMVVLLVFISALMNGDLLNNSVWLVFHSIVFSVIEINY